MSLAQRQICDMVITGPVSFQMKSTRWESVRQGDLQQFEDCKQEYLVQKKARQEAIRKSKRVDDTRTYSQGPCCPGSHPPHTL